MSSLYVTFCPLGRPISGISVQVSRRPDSRPLSLQSQDASELSAFNRLEARVKTANTIRKAVLIGLYIAKSFNSNARSKYVCRQFGSS